MAQPRFKNYSVDTRLDEWATALVEHRVLGFSSKAQVLQYALRRLIDQYLEWGVHPWSSYFRKQQDPRNSVGTLQSTPHADLTDADIKAILVGLSQSPEFKQIFREADEAARKP